MKALIAKITFENTASNMTIYIMMPFFSQGFIERAAHMPILVVLQPDISTFRGRKAYDYIEDAKISLPQINESGQTPFKSETAYICGVFSDIAKMLFHKGVTGFDGVQYYTPEIEMDMIVEVLKANHLEWEATKTTHQKAFQKRLKANLKSSLN